MDGDSDRSGGTCGLSDSGGLIDLSAVNSESPASKKGNSSLDKRECSSGDGKKRCKHPSGGDWLTEMEGKMKDMKWIEDEEFDFDIPEEYLNISLEDPSSPSTMAESFEEQNHPLVDRGKQDSGQEQPLLEIDQSVHPSLVDIDPPAVETLLDIERRVSSADSGVDSADSPQGPNFEEKGVPPDSPQGPKVFDITRNWPERRTIHRSSIDLGVLRSHTSATKFGRDSPFGATCNLLDVQSGSESQLFPSKEDLGVRRSSSASRLIAPSKHLRNCSTFSTPVLCSPRDAHTLIHSPNLQPVLCSPRDAHTLIHSPNLQPVLCSPRDELRAKEKLPNICALLASETFIVDSQQPGNEPVTSGGDTFRIEQPGSMFGVKQPCDSTKGQGGDLEDGSGFSVKHPGDTFRIERPSDPVTVEDSATFRVEQLDSESENASTFRIEQPEDSSTFRAPPPSSSSETFVISGGGSTTTLIASRECLDDSSSSCHSTASRESRGSTGHSSRLRTTAGGIPRRTKLTKPVSKPTLLPSKATGIAAAKPKGLRKPLEKPFTAKPSMMPRSHLQHKLKPQPHTVKGVPATGGGLKVPNRTKPLKALGGLKPPAINGAGKPTVQRRDSKSSVTAAIKDVLPATNTRETPSVCQNYILSATCTASDSNPPKLTERSTLLSTSMVSNSSPSVKQSTPIKSAVKETPKRSSAVTPRSLTGSTPKIQKFSLSSIEGGSTPSVKQRCPRTNETYTVLVAPAGGGSDPAAGSTPKSDRKKRRSFIPTPGGQDRVSKFTSPIPFNPNLSMDTELGNTGTEASPVAKVVPKRAMLPPKTRRALNPRASGLQRLQLGRGAVLGVRNGRSMARGDGPVKAQKIVGFGGYDFESEMPISRAKVVHSPIDKENRPATPHSEWSPIRRKRPLTTAEECTQCTKYNAM